ncbi:MAG: RidA family protein [Deltaproteobacteria bacterium]|nr:RidA family protein [Deltaproteobacteria bacterium]MBW2053571.1 RidA family protein [Deltaproteobacteria bacterium]MBW2324205.1 RidA family protein [Deltaproteobacteria bacterium]
MEKKTMDVDWLPKGGPYSHAVEAGDFIFVSGMVPMDARKNIVIMDDIKAATRLVLDNIKNLLIACGSNLDRAVKTTVFLRDMNDFEAMNEVYALYFPENKPARSCVAVKELPRNFPVEIELIALK